MEKALEKRHKLASITHYSIQTEQALKEEAQRQKLEYRKLVTPVTTRWNSEYMCMESCFHLKKALEVLGGSYDAFYGKTPTPFEWAMVAGSVHLLKKVKEISKLWSGDQYPTSMEVVPKLYDLLGKGGHLRRTDVFSKKNPPDNSTSIQLQQEECERYDEVKAMVIEMVETSLPEDLNPNTSIDSMDSSDSSKSKPSASDLLLLLKFQICAAPQVPWPN